MEIRIRRFVMLCANRFRYGERIKSFAKEVVRRGAVFGIGAQVIPLNEATEPFQGEHVTAVAPRFALTDAFGF